MEPFASVSDVEKIWGSTLVGADRTRVATRIDQASADIRVADTFVGGFSVDERMAESAAFTVTVRGVVADMVHRLLMNPQARLEVGIDDGRVRYDSSVSTGQMYISDVEFRKLFGGGRAGQMKAFTITPGSGPVFGDSQWI